VVEGNQRVAAVKSILFEHTHGTVDISEDKLQTLRALPIIELIGAPEERRHYQQTVMAIRHIAGIREWGPYQQAKLIVELYENEKHAFGQVAQRVGISSREVARRYRASKALQQMEDDEEFGEHANPKLDVFFHEAVSQPKV
jgi:AraC-like DNA-binding protein